jgi:hypothetical protein
MAKSRIYGLMAEFSTAEQLVEAAHRTHDAGYIRVDAFSPFPIKGLADAMRRSAIPSTWADVPSIAGRPLFPSHSN